MMTRSFSVYLFDIDGTLISCGGAGRRALERAFEDACGPIDGALGPLKLDGMTDRFIIREGLKLLDRPFLDPMCDSVLAKYVEHLMVEINKGNYIIHEGVVEALESLSSASADFGLCTGNIVEGAKVKLKRGGLDRWFNWDSNGIGGFGTDGEAREKVVEAALSRASASQGRRISPSEALVIGDTPRDVIAAHIVGCPVLAVATGSFNEGELHSAGAEYVVPTLRHPVARKLIGIE